MSLRFKSPQDTLVLLKKFIKKAGISRLADLSYLDDSSNIQIFSAIRPNAKSITISMGKSINQLEAQCGALIESIETYYAEEIKPQILNISQKELRNKNNLFIDLNEQNYGVTTLNNQKIDWCIGKTLIGKRDIYIPHISLSLDSNLQLSKIIGQNSDGIASGSNFKEALIYSFLELLERQSIKSNTKYQIEGINNDILKLININKITYSFYLYGNIFNLPVIGCNILNSNPLDNQVIIAGYSCSFSKFEAVNKSLLEAVQSKVGVISGARDDLDDSCYNFHKINTLVQPSEKMAFENILSFELSLDQQYTHIVSLLKSNRKDLAVFTYLDDDITILKTFMVNHE